MTRSKRANGRAAKRKLAVTGGRRPKPTKFHGSSPGKYTSELETDVATLTLRDTLRTSQPNWSSNSAKLRDKSMKFVPSSDIDAFKQAEPPIDREVQQPKDEVSTADVNDVQATSPSPSNSSEDVVVFSGRARSDQNHEIEDRKPLRQCLSDINDEKENSAEIPVHQPTAQENMSWVNIGQNWLHREERAARTLQQKTGVKPVGSTHSGRPEIANSTSHRYGLLLHTLSKPVREDWDHAQTGAAVVPPSENHSTEVEEIATADYIQNVAKWEPDVADAWTASARHLDDWSRSDLEDFDDLSTSDEVCDKVDQVLSKRYRKGSLQYLIVWDGQSIDDARWIPSSSLTMSSAQDRIQQYEEKEELTLKLSIGIENSESDEDIENESGDTDSSGIENDENDREERNDRLMRRRMEKMTDEQLARLFAKQEELGIQADELLIFDQHVEDDHDEDENDEEDDEEDDDDMEDDDLFAGEADALLDSTTASRFAARYRTEPAFAEGALDALEHDDYRDFDIMDFDRPSLVKGSRRKRGESPSFGLSDSDLEQSLKRAWAADRDKKRTKKQEREEMRIQGILGKKHNSKPDLKAKYSRGLSLEDFKEQLESFLDSDHTTLSLPPMDKKDRRTIHTIVNSFNLRSKSQGNGKSRFTIIYRTSRTIEFSETLFSRVASRAERHFFPRMDRPKGHGATFAKKSRAQAGVSYGHGETVGAGAPELGVENRGRAMLERMGWTKGDALGSLENQGILQPIAHVVRKSRVGLG